MSHIKPYLTSSSIVDAIKRKILLPTSQNTFKTEDILAFVNEELLIGTVPEILSFNEEYFVYSIEFPLEPTKIRYPIPKRAIGMKLRDVAYRDGSGNLYEMTRISPDDKSYFQKGVNYNNSIEKFYIEGNDLVLAQSPQSLPAGALLFTFYLRPNKLVRESRHATITSFVKRFTVENVFINSGDKLVLGATEYKMVASNSGSITGVTPSLTKTSITSVNHGLTTGYKVTISGSSTSPSINGTYTISVIDADTFEIPKATISGTGVGTWTSSNLIPIGLNSNVTTSNTITAINANNGDFNASLDPSSNSMFVVEYTDINTVFQSSNVNGISTDDSTKGLRFDSFPLTDFNSETGVTEDLFHEGLYVDLLQTDPGHKTRAYDVLIPVGGIVTATDVYFYADDIPSDLVVGDYVCLANECIIPQIPPDLHSVLADKSCARILSSIGDLEGLSTITNKLAENKNNQSYLVDNRVEGAPIKINSNHTLLRYQKWTYRRRF